MSKIFFTADLHIGHKNILKYLPNRPLAIEQDTLAHDEWLIDLWCSTVGKRDRIYILGDLTFYKSEEARRLLKRLPGYKYFIYGNHDGSIKSYTNYFQKYVQILETTIRARDVDILQSDLQLVMCHYPLLDWNNKFQGSVMLHGHCHGIQDAFNRQSKELRFDVGIDGELARRSSGFINIETLYDSIMEKTGGKSIQQYVRDNR